jgi:hypothetical protein
MQPSEFEDGDEKERDAWLKRQIGRLTAAYPSFKPDERVTAEWRGVLYELRKKRGRSAVAEAIDKIIHTVPKFVPSLAEVPTFLPHLEVRLCESCRDTYGWVYVPAQAGRLPTVVRCKHAGA